MECSFEMAAGSVIVSVRGRIDETTWEQFATHLSAGIEQAVREKRPTLIINFSEMDYMSSRGLRVLTMAKRQAEGAQIAIVLAAPNDVMREILAISRYDKLFEITDAI